MTRGVHSGASRDDQQCGVGSCRNFKFLQHFANAKFFVVTFGILGCVYGASYSYSNATISTIEKRFKIPSKITGIISVGNDVSSIFCTMLLSYYAGKGHRPRWIAAGMYAVALFCFLTFLPHLLWGAGEDALALTVEHGGAPDADLTAEVLMMQNRKTLCRAWLNVSLARAECRNTGVFNNSGLAPAILLFFAQFISGFGGALYYTLGMSYIDDNVKKSESPFLISVSYFMRMLGPAFGYTMGSYFLNLYIVPSLTPTISNNDPRWLGAWWAGWLVLGVTITVLGSAIGMFPHKLPHERQTMGRGATDVAHEKASLKDMTTTIIRISRNKIFLVNIIAAMLYSFGFMPFWIYSPKYIEIQYHTSASRANFYTGSVGLVCSALGVLFSGIVISRFKPRARYLAAWNVFLSVVSIVTILTYPFLGCEQSDLQSSQMKLDVQQECNVECHCDFVKYSPVCSEDGRTTFISACHAGCRDQIIEDGRKVNILTGLLKAPSLHCSSLLRTSNVTEVSHKFLGGGRAHPGVCSVDCSSKFYAYVTMMCLLKLCLASGRTSNMLIGVRCVEERDKAASLGLDVVLFNLFVYIPSPILYGFIIDSTCLVWGQTCTGTGNCWQYDGEFMRFLINLIAAAFVLVGTLFDVAVWYYVKDLQVFDKDETKDGRRVSEEDVGRELIEVHRDQDKQRHLADVDMNTGENQMTRRE